MSDEPGDRHLSSDPRDTEGGRSQRGTTCSRGSTLELFWRKYPDAEQPLRAWFQEVEHASWKGPSNIRERYGAADFLANDRVVFDIRGNKYRLIVAVKYEFHCVHVRFVGTRAEYDEIDAATV